MQEAKSPMLLFADGDNFWTMKTVIDLIAVVGLFLTLFSIWFSWWLAKRDLSQRIASAQAKSTRVLQLISAPAGEFGASRLAYS